jgi:hypothetical protein
VNSAQLRIFTLATSEPGWVAVDSVSLVREAEGCRVLPESAEPTTSAPTPSTSQPPNEGTAPS